MSDRLSWLGTPVTVPLPVTVIRPACCAAAVRVTGEFPVPPDDPPRPAPRLNAPTRSAAAATPTPAARYPGVMLMAMTGLLRL